jgi:hypothetical protein
MKFAHNLRSAESISKRELERALKGSLGGNFSVDTDQMDRMVEGIMKVCIRVYEAKVLNCLAGLTNLGSANHMQRTSE